MITTEGVEERFLQRNRDQLYLCRCGGQRFVPCAANGAPLPPRPSWYPSKTLMRCPACGLVVDETQCDDEHRAVPVVGRVVADPDDLRVTVRWTETVSYERVFTVAELRDMLDDEDLPRWEWTTIEGLVRIEDLPGCGELTSALAGIDSDVAFLAVEERDIDSVTVHRPASGTARTGGEQ